ncbi:hypothetical protein COU61_01550 [Candidatus Pacearchaeota archaeon CG10_big_fil_rev_8_21_14_0_10_35_13]|nr:MAG: hypothetical protein COU61_01550 [Candidatus Pacearchaeota archaeon CG10_big_fil_rev_8_21_14_0_10_35_13]
MIISYFFAHYVFDNDFLTFEFFVFLHLMMAFFVSFYYFLTKSHNSLASLIGSLALVFSGYSLIASSNWYYVIPSLFFLPLLLLLSDKLLYSGGLRWVVITGILRGVYFYSGNAQYFAFTLIFEFLYLLFSYRKVSGSARFLLLLERYLLSLLITLVVITPLLFSQLSVVGDSLRGNNNFITYVISKPSSPVDLFLGSFFVSPLVSSASPFAYAPSSFIQIYFVGVLFALMFLVGAYLSFSQKKNFSEASIIKNNLDLFWLAIISMVLSLGLLGVIYLVGAFIPVIKNFSNPFKITLYTNFFIIAFGTVVFGWFVNNKFSKKIIIFIVSLFFIILSYHLFVSSGVAWSYYGDSLPLNLKLHQDFGDYRFVSVFTNSAIQPTDVKHSSNDNNFAHSKTLTQNFATYYSLNHISGYEPFEDLLTHKTIPISRFGISGHHLNLTTLRDYGVKYILIHPTSLEFHDELSNLSLMGMFGEFLILNQSGVKPLVFSDSVLPDYSLEGSIISFKTSVSYNQNFTVNLLFKNNYFVSVDGDNVPVVIDDLGRLSFSVPIGTHNVVIRYIPVEFFYGIIISLIILIIIGVYIVRRKNFRGFLSSLNFRTLSIKRKKSFFVIFFIFLLLLFFYLLFVSFFTPKNFSGVINERTNLLLEFSDVGMNIFRGRLFLNDIAVFGGSGNFSIGSAILGVDYGNSLKKTIVGKSPIIIFSEVILHNLSVSSNSLNFEDFSVCDNPLMISIPRSLNNSYFNISSDYLLLKNFSFKPLNKAYISSGSDGLFINGVSNNSLIINVSVEKFVHGKIIVGDGGISVSKCLSLPLIPNNNLYY